jgi:thiosulfate/3-mercaptopyruvate sulfurtransferase
LTTSAGRCALLLSWLLTGLWSGSVSPTASAAAKLEPLTPLVDTAWLARQLGEPYLVVLDIRSPIGGADLRSYVAGHVPGAVYSNFVTDPWHDHDSGVPASLPPVAQLEGLLGRLGVGNDTVVVLVHGGTDSADFSTAARLYWLVRLLGHDRVAILDGGMRAWTRAGLPLERGWNEPKPTSFVAATFRDEWLATTDEVANALPHDVLLVDARLSEQYRGRAKPGPVARPGTIPGALNLEHRKLIDPETGRFLGAYELAVLLRDTGIDNPDGEVVTFCNFGYLSAAVWFALHEIAGFSKVKLYDGSMAEWASSAERLVVVVRDDDPGGR